MDLLVFQFFYNLAHQSGFSDAIIIVFAKYLPYFLAVGWIWFLAILKPRRKQIFAITLSVLSALISRGFFTELIRYFYGRPRPFETLNFQPLFMASHHSFPSGHVSFFFAIALAIFYFNHRLGYWFIALAFLNGLGRVAAGVHWPTDILGGIAVAAVSFLLVKKILPSPDYTGEASKKNESPVR
jgi:undecaprenyl-diphosphatase